MAKAKTKAKPKAKPKSKPKAKAKPRVKRKAPAKKRKTRTKPHNKQIPTKAMIRFLRAKLDPTVKPTITAECEDANVGRRTYYDWLENPKYVRWFKKAFAKGMKDSVPYLKKVGLIMAARDHRYWKDMLIMEGDFSPDEEEKIKKMSKAFEPGTKIVFTVKDPDDEK